VDGHGARGSADPRDPRVRSRSLRLLAPFRSGAGDRGFRLRRGQPLHRCRPLAQAERVPRSHRKGARAGCRPRAHAGECALHRCDGLRQWSTGGGTARSGCRWRQFGDPRNRGHRYRCDRLRPGGGGRECRRRSSARGECLRALHRRRTARGAAAARRRPRRDLGLPARACAAVACLRGVCVPGATAGAIRLAGRAVPAGRTAQRLPAEAHACHDHYRDAYGPHRQRRPGAAPGGGPGL